MDRDLEDARSQQKVRVKILHSQNKEVPQQLLGILESKKEHDMVKLMVQSDQLTVGMEQEQERVGKHVVYPLKKKIT